MRRGKTRISREEPPPSTPGVHDLSNDRAPPNELGKGRVARVTRTCGFVLFCSFLGNLVGESKIMARDDLMERVPKDIGENKKGGWL